MKWFYRVDICVLPLQRCAIITGVVHTMVHTTVGLVLTSILITTGEDAVASTITTGDTAAKHGLTL